MFFKSKETVFNKNALKCLKESNYDLFLQSYTLLEINDPQNENICSLKAFKILILILKEKIEELNLFFLTLKKEEILNSEIQFAIQIFDLSELWGINELKNLLKNVKNKEIKKILNGILENLHEKTEKKIEYKTESRDLDESLKNLINLQNKLNDL